MKVGGKNDEVMLRMILCHGVGLPSDSTLGPDFHPRTDSL